MDIQSLYELIQTRKIQMPENSYTTYLFTEGRDKIVKKVGEEAIEVVLAATAQTRERLVEEIADLTYHVLVLMAQQGIEPRDILDELTNRHAG